MLALCAAALAGCVHHQDTVDTVTQWYHQYQGGVISHQRPPPPGTHQPYPKIGLGPHKAPELPSPDLREDITADLEAQHELNERQDAIMGTMPTMADIPPIPSHTQFGTESASLKAADSPATPAGTAATATPAPQGTAMNAATAPRTGPDGRPLYGSNGLLLMPEVSTMVSEHPEAIPANLPPIAQDAPALPKVGGITLPDNAERDGLDLPNYHLASADDGPTVHFLPGSDHIADGEDEVVNNAVKERGGNFIIVNGYGNASNATAEGQTAALNLAILRTRTITTMLVARGVPAASIVVRAHAFGNGARIAVLR
ncbi:hypothetical protein LV564_01700 [Komagataeibacter nataicola]|nr:hypothetical protein [Komagataeibacter nataicola]WEQ55856.1 hypothetical protein LV564_01700 [Komagataeibacter nataicola]WNM09283.1 hypothetical protein RI056_04665 [Komagataeibacter nataicola]GBR14783.1 hypothetical protein AA0616_0395 [Komagataeibacter nataicola NRIC 0616]